MIVKLSVLVSATTATRCYLLYMYAADGILGSASVRHAYLGRQACAVQNTSNSTECAQLLLYAQCAQGTCSLEL